jgi:hypothetical protein
MTSENEIKYRQFMDKLRNEPIYFINDFEQAAIRSLPTGVDYWVKFKGREEFKAVPGSKLVSEGIREYTEITEEQYKLW